MRGFNLHLFVTTIAFAHCSGAPTSLQENLLFQCPLQCTCHDAPLYNAPFIHTWLKSSHLDYLPSLHINEILDEGAIAAAHSPAEEAGVDTKRTGIHATCALYPDTSLAAITARLPPSTMVLSILQAAGSNRTVIEGDHFAHITGLIALHLEGFVENKPPLWKPLTSRGPYKIVYTDDLNMVLADDALKTLPNLEILDLQYVRLTSEENSSRLRRHVFGPVSTTNIFDLPLHKFLKYTDDLAVDPLPAHIRGENFEFEEKYNDSLDQIEENSNSKSNKIYLNYDELDKTDEELHNEGFVEEFNLVLLNGTSNIKQNYVPYTTTYNENTDFFAPFAAQNALKYLRIAHAHLDYLGAEVLQGLTNLHTLLLEFNNIRVLPHNVFASTPSIEHLSLAHNSLLAFDGKYFNGLINLNTLDLEHNKISIVGPSSLPYLPKLRKLFLEGNPIQHILPDSFLGINSTEVVEFGSKLAIARIHEGALQHLTNLKHLKLSNITFESLTQEIFKDLGNLEHLTIHGNITSINFDAFTSVPNLLSLDISNCNISKLSVDAFFGLTKLTKLDLSRNMLQELNPGTFDHLSSLRELYLQRNKLTTLPVGIFTPLMLQVLRLNHNPWDCSCNMLQLHPTVTNSVIQTTHQLCSHDSKQNIICDDLQNKLVFNTRIAPKCFTPIQYKNKDVYTVATRYLKCSKFEWDPILHTDPPNLDKPFSIPKKKQRNQPVNKTDNKESRDQERRIIRDDPNVPDESTRLGWRPLQDFTPPPIKPVDLLKIAEQDMLVEARPDRSSPTSLTLMTTPQTPVSQENNLTTLSKEEHKQRLAESIEQYRTSKKKIKEQLKLERIREIQKLVWEKLNTGR